MAKLSSDRLDNSDKSSPPPPHSLELDYPTPPHLISLSSTIFLRSPDPSFVIKSLHNPNPLGYNISINTTNSQNSNSFFLNTTGCKNRGTIPLAYSANSFNMNNSHDSAVTDNRSEILTWLSPLELHLRHNNIRTTRVKDVGDWLLRTEEFRSWKDGDGRSESQKATMFCPGNLGVGKTCIR